MKGNPATAYEAGLAKSVVVVEFPNVDAANATMRVLPIKQRFGRSMEGQNAICGWSKAWIRRSHRMDAVRLMVFSHEGGWRIRVGDKLSRPYKSQNEAIHSAFDYAKVLAQEGLEAEVVLKVLTYRFGPNGFFKALPTPLRPANDDV